MLVSILIQSFNFRCRTSPTRSDTVNKVSTNEQGSQVSKTLRRVGTFLQNRRQYTYTGQGSLKLPTCGRKGLKKKDGGQTVMVVKERDGQRCIVAGN